VAGALLLGGCAGAAAGCFDKRPTQVLVTQVAPAIHPAKPPDCDMPVLTEEPTAGYQQIAIVEAWGAAGQEDQVLAALKSSGCETGADALVIVEDQSQDNAKIAKFGLPMSNEDEEARMDLTQGQRFKKDSTPKVGEAGHPGYYLDSVAIVYDKIKAASQPVSH